MEGGRSQSVAVRWPSRVRLWRALVACLLALCAWPGSAAAGVSVDPADTLTYMPAQMVNSTMTSQQVATILGELGDYGIGQALLQMPRFTKKGTVKLPQTNGEMLGVWSSEAASYDAEHGADLSVTAVFNVALKARGLNLEDPATRSRMLAAIESAVRDGVGGIQLDVEPFPVSDGFIELLEEVRAMLRAHGVPGRFSVVAPGDTWRWPAAYLQRVAAHVDQVDPTFYDSESSEIAEYQQWVEQGLAYYAANVPAGVRIVPVIPSYKRNPWHDPAVENIATATGALAQSLRAGDRVNGAGIWWWYGFYEEESGHYKAARADRLAWLTETLALPFSP